MKLILLILMALLVMAVSAAVPAVAQHDHDGDRHDKYCDDDRETAMAAAMPMATKSTKTVTGIMSATNAMSVMKSMKGTTTDAFRKIISARTLATSTGLSSCVL